MAFYRVKQFLWGATSIFKKIDYNYLSNFLTDDEIKIFNQLKHSDKHHCIRVCKDSIELKNKLNIDIDTYKLGEAALLHDVGKSAKHLSLIEKSFVVLADKFTKGKIKKYSNIKQIDIYYNHPKIGVKILENRGFKEDKELFEVVKYHHNSRIKTNNKYLNIIKECDNKN